MPNMQQETCEYFLPNWYQCRIRRGMPCDDMAKICKSWRYRIKRKKIAEKKNTWFDMEPAPRSKHHYKDSKGVRF